MKRYVLLAGLLLPAFFLQAQKHYAVMVSDSKTAKPIEGASIKILSTGEIAKTSPAGNVVMLISPTDSLLITAKGFKDRKLMMAGQFIALTIILDPAPEKPAVKAKSKRSRN